VTIVGNDFLILANWRAIELFTQETNHQLVIFVGKAFLRIAKWSAIEWSTRGRNPLFVLFVERVLIRRVLWRDTWSSIWSPDGFLRFQRLDFLNKIWKIHLPQKQMKPKFNSSTSQHSSAVDFANFLIFGAISVSLCWWPKLLSVFLNTD
jgi:hypothetical protein